MTKWAYRFVALWFVVMVALALIGMSNAKASESCRHHDKCDKPAPVTQVTIVEKDRFTGEDFLKSAGILAISGCGITSIYQGVVNDRWRWPYEWCLSPLLEKNIERSGGSSMVPSNANDPSTLYGVDVKRGGK